MAVKILAVVFQWVTTEHSLTKTVLSTLHLQLGEVCTWKARIYDLPSIASGLPSFMASDSQTIFFFTRLKGSQSH